MAGVPGSGAVGSKGDPCPHLVTDYRGGFLLKPVGTAEPEEAGGLQASPARPRASPSPRRLHPRTYTPLPDVPVDAYTCTSRPLPATGPRPPNWLLAEPPPGEGHGHSYSPWPTWRKDPPGTVPNRGAEVVGKTRRARPPLAPLFGGPEGEAGAGAATNGPGDAGKEEEEEEEEYRLLTVTLSKLKHSLGGWHMGETPGVGWGGDGLGTLLLAPASLVWVARHWQGAPHLGGRRQNPEHSSKTRKGEEELPLPQPLICVVPTKTRQERWRHSCPGEGVPCLRVGGGPSLPGCEGLAVPLQGSASLVASSQGRSRW